MKTKLSVLLVLSCLSIYSHAQIKVHSYQHEISCDIDALADLPTINATSPIGKVSLAYSENIYSGGCLGTLVRTFTYSDAAGNTGEAQQIVHITDHTPPRLLGEAPNITTTPDMVPEPAQFAAVDNSGESFDVIFKEVKQEKRITRLWTCTDSCGNVARKTQVILFE
jgi:large repetitive protein